ncbi:MAG: helix-turn-helix domain-containing protein, partial [Variovorax sp.]
KSRNVDHRPRVGQERRERMRARIIGAALDVFARKGPDAPLIDDFIKAAGVARGTFYRYFQSTEQLLEATTMQLQDEVMRAIEGELSGIDDPVQRLGTGVMLWLERARGDPAWCAFTVRVRPQSALVEQTLLGDLRGGKRVGEFSFATLQVAHDLVVGTVREGMRRMIDGPVPRAYSRDVVRLLLRGLGLDFARIEQVLANAPKPRPAARRTAGPTPATSLQ